MALPRVQTKKGMYGCWSERETRNLLQVWNAPQENALEHLGLLHYIPTFRPQQQNSGRMRRLLLQLRRPRPVVTYSTLTIIAVSFLHPFCSPLALAVSPPSSSSSSNLKRLPRLSILSTAEKKKLLLPPYLLDAIQSAANKDNASVLVRQQRDNQESLRIEYQLFQQGKSSLRDISNKDALALLSCLVHSKNPSSTSNAAVALLLLMCGRREDGHSSSSVVGRLVPSDAAHEVVLGVNLENYRQAEYTVMHRGRNDTLVTGPSPFGFRRSGPLDPPPAVRRIANGGRRVHGMGERQVLGRGRSQTAVPSSAPSEGW